MMGFKMFSSDTDRRAINPRCVVEVFPGSDGDNSCYLACSDGRDRHINEPFHDVVTRISKYFDPDEIIR